jgi:hypothetical protein
MQRGTCVRSILFVFLILMWAPIRSQAQASCGLTSMIETVKPMYLPLARAAHIEGSVILLVGFALNGLVEHIDVVGGPVMLRDAALNYVKGWQANAYGGSRTCPIVITYAFAKEGQKVSESGVRIDMQHVMVYSDGPPCLCDPRGYIGKRKTHFLFF